MASRFLTEAAASLLVRVVAMLAGLATSIVTARVLGPDGRGLYFYVLTLALLAVQIGAFGQHAWNAYRVARVPADAPILLGNSVVQSLVVVPVIALALVVIAWLAGSGHAAGPTVLVAVLMAPSSLFLILGSHLLVGLRRVPDFNRAQLLGSVLPFACISIAALVNRTTGAMLAASALGGWLACAWLFRRLRAGLPAPLAGSWGLLRDGLGYATRAFIVGGLSVLFVRLNVVMLERLAPVRELGWYSIGSQIMDALVVLPASVALILFPRLAAPGGVGWSATIRVATWVGVCACVVCGLLWAVLPWLVPLVFGADFLPAARITRWLLPAVVALSVTSVLSQLPAARGFPPVTMAVWLAALVLNAVLCFWLVPAEGAIGAAAALSVAAGLACIAMTVVAFRCDRGNAAAAREALDVR